MKFDGIQYLKIGKKHLVKATSVNLCRKHVNKLMFYKQRRIKMEL